MKRKKVKKPLNNPKKLWAAITGLLKAVVISYITTWLFHITLAFISYIHLFR